jgi:hypothetical protein
MLRLLAVLREGDTVMQRAMLLGMKRRVEDERSLAEVLP